MCMSVYVYEYVCVSDTVDRQRRRQQQHEGKRHEARDITLSSRAALALLPFASSLMCVPEPMPGGCEMAIDGLQWS